MTLSSALRIDVCNAFMALQQAIERLCQQIQQDKTLVAWMANEPPLNGTEARDYAQNVLRQLEYSDGQAPREIIVCPGLIGASAETLTTAAALNHQKDQFKQTIQQLKSEKTNWRDERLNQQINKQLDKRAQQTSRCLNKMGLSRLHLKQCYRKLPLLPNCPSKVSWTWANTRSIKRISVEQAQALLLKKTQSEAIMMQLHRLSRLHQDEPLAIVQELAPHMRANLVYGQAPATERAMVKGPVPLFFPADAQTVLPNFRPPKAKSARDENRTIRSDTRLDPNAYLPAIRVHRYLKEPSERV